MLHVSSILMPRVPKFSQPQVAEPLEHPSHLTEKMKKANLRAPSTAAASDFDFLFDLDSDFDFDFDCFFCLDSSGCFGFVDASGSSAAISISSSLSVTNSIGRGAGADADDLARYSMRCLATKAESRTSRPNPSDSWSRNLCRFRCWSFRSCRGVILISSAPPLKRQ